MLETGQTPVVSIISLTYNHAPYIRECLEGFLMQKTDFPFEVIIHDDASTDGTADIVREYAAKYPDIIKPIIQTENQYSKHHDFNKILKGCLDKSLGKYIAFCEGDDYWIDPLKLQKQVDFLESHPDYGMVYSFSNIRVGEDILKNKIFGKDKCSFQELLIDGNCIPTLTTMFKLELIENYIKNINPSKQNWRMGDYPMWLYIAKNSKIKCIPATLGVYRCLEESASHSKNINKLKGILQSDYDVRSFFSQKYGVGDFDIEYKHLQTLTAYLKISDDNFRSLCNTQLNKCHLSFLLKTYYKLRIRYSLFNRIAVLIKALKNRIK